MANAVAGRAPKTKNRKAPITIRVGRALAQDATDQLIHWRLVALPIDPPVDFVQSRRDGCVFGFAPREVVDGSDDVVCAHS